MRARRPVLWTLLAALSAIQARSEPVVLDASLRLESIPTTPALEHPLALAWSPDGSAWVADAAGRLVQVPGPGATNGPVAVRPIIDGLSAPTSLLPWRGGLLVADPPDLLHIETSRTPPQAHRLFIGFGVLNPSRRITALSYGLDGWIYASTGRGGGTVRALDLLGPAAIPDTPDDIDLTLADFRCQPDLGRLEAIEGPSEGGRTRDDFGRWFANDPQHRLWLYPLPSRYTRRNPHADYPEPQSLVGEPAPPAAPLALDAPLPAPPGLEIYRDTALGPAHLNAMFVCASDRAEVLRYELPAANLDVQVAPERRTRGEPFIRGESGAFVPIQLRTGPDGTLWIVDAGSATAPGGLHRVRPTGGLRQTPDVLRSPPSVLVALLEHPNGPLRDLAHQELLRRTDAAADARLLLLADPARGGNARSPVARVHALWILSSRGALPESVLRNALASETAAVRETALVLLEPAWHQGSPLPPILSQLAHDLNPRVRVQLALSLGEATGPNAADLLARLLTAAPDDPWLTAAVLSSAHRFPGRILRAFLDATAQDRPETRSIVATLLQTAAGSADADEWDNALAALARPDAPTPLPVRWAAAAVALQSSAVAPSRLTAARESLRPLRQLARRTAAASAATTELRQAALPLLGYDASDRADDRTLLLHLLTQASDHELRDAAVLAFQQLPDAETATQLWHQWAQCRPSLRPRLLGLALRQPDWIPPLLDAIAQGFVAATEISPANRERLQQHAAPALADRARRVLADILPPRRTTVLERHAEALALPANPSRGQALLDQHCVACHSLRGVGQPVGPDLATIGQRSPSELLESILDPNAVLEPRYLTLEVETNDGDAAAGLLKSETNDRLILTQGRGIEIGFDWPDVRGVRVSNFSLMPEGFDAVLTPQDLADLIAALRRPSP